ncbi:sodium-coupled neutral amino acid transporter 7-like isoform X2 [Lycorma delicatula]|uniref:sodium-coupled neutral amino acid transporter 7-like isoform X2 n=1 Tax=Lycorma delicatula TaxID=130591 RepID=UPI003F515977
MAEEGDEKTLGIFSAAVLIGNAAVGAGILNFPEAFEFAGGIIVAMIVQLVLLIFVILGLVVLAILTIELNVETMQQMLLVTSGKFWSILSIFLIPVYSFFCCVAYHVVIGDQFDRAFYNISGKDFCHTWYMNRKFTIIVASVILMLPFLFPKKIDFLKYISQIGVAAIFYVIVLVIVQYFIGDYDKGKVEWVPKDILKVSMTLPPFCFAYHAHIQSVPVFASIKNRSFQAVVIISCGSMIGCLILYSLTGSFGYLTFGNYVRSNILLNYPADNVIVIIALLVVAFKICCVYPLVVFCGRDAVIDLYLQATGKSSETGDLARRVVVALIWFWLAVALALLFPNIGVVIDVLGFFVAFFTFLFPGVSLLNRPAENATVNSKIAAIILIVLGLIFSIMSLAVVIYRLIKGEEGHNILCQ